MANLHGRVDIMSDASQTAEWPDIACVHWMSTRCTLPQLQLRMFFLPPPHTMRSPTHCEYHCNFLLILGQFCFCKNVCLCSLQKLAKINIKGMLEIEQKSQKGCHMKPRLFMRCVKCVCVCQRERKKVREIETNFVTLEPMFADIFSLGTSLIFFVDA